MPRRWDEETVSAVLALLALAASGPSVEGVASEDRSGPSRWARCRIDGKPVSKCRFTPLFGDGSFNIRLKGVDELRVVVSGDSASVFEVFGPEKRVALLAVGAGWVRVLGD